MISFTDLAEQNQTRCKRWHPEGSHPWRGAEWSNATIGEVGEAIEALGRVLKLANTAKKLGRQETEARSEFDPEWDVLVGQLADEIADSVIYADLLAQYFGIELGAAVASKFNRTSERYGFPERLG